MTLLRRFVKGAENFWGSKRCIVLGKSNFNADYYFGSKIQIPSPPKRPLSAYMIFCKEKRKELLQESPYLKAPEQIKILAEKWGHLSEDLKRPYELSARKSTQIYGEQHKNFYESLTEEQRNEITRLKRERAETRRNLRIKKDLLASGLPKPPGSAYVMFVQAEAKKKPEINNPTDFIKNVAKSWKSLPEETKKFYEKQVEEDKITFANEMNVWRARMIADGKEKLVQAYDDMKKKGKLADSKETSIRKRKVTKKPVKESPVASKE